MVCTWVLSPILAFAIAVRWRSANAFVGLVPTAACLGLQSRPVLGVLLLRVGPYTVDFFYSLQSDATLTQADTYDYEHTVR